MDLFHRHRCVKPVKGLRNDHTVDGCVIQRDCDVATIEDLHGGEPFAQYLSHPGVGSTAVIVAQYGINCPVIIPVPAPKSRTWTSSSMPSESTKYVMASKGSPVALAGNARRHQIRTWRDRAGARSNSTSPIVKDIPNLRGTHVIPAMENDGHI